jgi:protocatechuate 3,4-dioxygenase, beta subunit
MKFPTLDPAVRANVRHTAYGSTALRAPQHDSVAVSSPSIAHPLQFNFSPVARDADLTVQGAAAPLGERIIVSGRVTDEDGKPLSHSLVEIWQCNSTGRYLHARDQHDAPLDPNFAGHGRCLTDADGYYRFVTIKPGAYPWRNHANAWRPAHIHFSLFGNAYAQRLITQMYFPNDPLFEFDPIFQSIADVAARQRMVSRFDLGLTQTEWALGYRFDIVLRGANATPFEA